jgi:DNA-directed RNA polymerase I subunit RPA43
MDLDAAPVSKKPKSKTKPQPKSNSKPVPAPRYTGLPPQVLTGSGSASVPAVAAPVAATRAEPTEEIDERFLSARELKKKRKDDEKKKRDARKSKKEEKQLEEVAAIGGERLVGVSEEDAVRDVEGLGQAQEGKKRKAEDETEGKKKKRKEKA